MDAASLLVRVPPSRGVRLASVCQGFVPDLPPQGMLGQPFDLLRRPLSGKPLERL
jgi:hypothetical protein